MTNLFEKDRVDKMTMDEKMREQAVKCLNALNLHPNVIEDFKEGIINYSLKGGLYWLSEDLKEKIEEVEKERGILVYHCIRSFTNFGELIDCLYVSKYEDEWRDDLKDIKKRQMYSFCINLGDPFCSEFGLIGIKPMWGGVLREW